MSWQNTWGTVRATNAKACALYCEIADVGKTIESSKKRVIWRLKVEDGREFEIILTHSLASGKKILRVDGIIKYTSQSLSFGDWDHVFNLPGGYVVHIIIKPSVELNDMYDLIIDGMSFRRLPDRLDPNRAKSSGGVASATSSSARTGSGGAGGSRTNSYTYNYSNGGSGYTRPSSRESSFSPWPCSRCTLVNEKPLAPICEACGAPKPDYISCARDCGAPLGCSCVENCRSKVHWKAAKPIKASEPDFFSTPNASAPDNSNDFGAFGSDPFVVSSSSAATSASFATTHNSFAPEKPTTADISSMLSGLDFTAVPVQPTPSSDGTLQSPSSPNPAGDSNTRSASGDLWDSKMVDLDLNPKTKLKTVSAKSYQTLEQARLQAPKEKVAMLPTPPAPIAVTAIGFYSGTANMPPGGYYQQSPGMMQQPMYNTTVGAGYGMVPPSGGFGAMHNSAAYGTHFGAPQQQFVTQMQQQPGNNAFPPSKPNAFGSDPFATLS